MTQHKPNADDESLAFLNKFVELFEDMVQHNGYGDINIHVQLLDSNTRLVVMGSGKEYRYRIKPPRIGKDGERRPSFKVSRTRGAGPLMGRGEDRRSSMDRRKGDRRKNREPRNFRLERRRGRDRRQFGDRRKH